MGLDDLMQIGQRCSKNFCELNNYNFEPDSCLRIFLSLTEADRGARWQTRPENF